MRLTGSHAAIVALLSTACTPEGRPALDTAGPAPASATAPVTAGTPETPTSVRYDAELDVYYFANTRSEPGRRDNGGYIARVGADSGDGAVRLVEGGRNGVTLHAPQSIALRGDTLHVLDVDAVRMFDRHTGAPIGTVGLSAQQAAFLKDSVAGPDGIYMTDMGVVRTADGARGAASVDPLVQMIGAADAAMSGPMSPAARSHLRLTPTRRPTPGDSVRARRVADELRAALAPFGDTAAAAAADYRLMMPRLTGQRTLHFTNFRHALAEAFRFDPAKPTSLLYERTGDGSLRLIGAMYTAPRRTRADRLDARIPFSIARWHQHVDWCLPKGGEGHRLIEQRNGLPLFGPDSPIASRSECEAVGGKFYPNIFGWMLHANVLKGTALHAVFGDHH